MFTQTKSQTPSVYIIHENAEWTAPLFSALEGYQIPYHDWDTSSAIFDLSVPAPNGIFYNRMSASSHTRGNRFAPEMTTGILAWLESQGRPTLNGRRALNLEISKLVQYAALERVGLSTPKTFAVSSREDIVKAYKALPLDDVITKHNRAGKGLGVQLLKSEEAAIEHINSSSFEDSVDGLTLVQQYINAPDSSITRVEFIGREFFYAVKVDASNGFELCPADVCALDGGFCATEGDERFPFSIIDNFQNTDAGGSLLPKMRAVMENEGLDVAGFEFVTDDIGNHYCYDINTNTNYNSDAENRYGSFAMQRVAQYLGAELAAHYGGNLKMTG
tara:strand:- start:4763 stop:5758 length:996 start_codon:yes stop_codon:yes gene_type:complete